MRRKDKEIQDKDLQESILQKALVCRIGLCENNVPYIVPMNFAYENNSLYIHSTNSGKKIDMFKANDTVCFEIDIDCEAVQAEKPCDWGMKYYSIIGTGKAIFLDSFSEKETAMNIITKKYTGNKKYPFSEKDLSNLSVIEIKILKMTGKRSGYAAENSV